MTVSSGSRSKKHFEEAMDGLRGLRYSMGCVALFGDLLADDPQFPDSGDEF